jgi:ADP-ribose pyrophosphatase YjhB (NUDIX family)
MSIYKSSIDSIHFCILFHRFFLQQNPLSLWLCSGEKILVKEIVLKYVKEMMTFVVVGAFSSVGLGAEIYRSDKNPDGLMHYRALFEDHPGYAGVTRKVGMPSIVLETYTDLNAQRYREKVQAQIDFEKNRRTQEDFTWEIFGGDQVDYRPVNYTHPNVIWNDSTRENVAKGELAPADMGTFNIVTKGPDAYGAWADPEDIQRLYYAAHLAPALYWQSRTAGKKVEGDIRYSFHGIRLVSYLEDDFHGREYPRNPVGPTGLRGRGLLGNWGANQASDPLITRLNLAQRSESNPLGVEFLMIKRLDNGQWALPGGMLERANGALPKGPMKQALTELFEESGLDLEGTFDRDSQLIYAGYVDDPRNTDNAWMESSVFHLHLTEALRMTIGERKLNALAAGDDAGAAKWAPVGGLDYLKLFASHRKFVDLAVARLAAESAAQ